jgi:hypothetical protein
MVQWGELDTHRKIISTNGSGGVMKDSDDGGQTAWFSLCAGITAVFAAVVIAVVIMIWHYIPLPLPPL